MSSATTSPVLQLSGVGMRFGRVHVLQDAQLRWRDAGLRSIIAYCNHCAGLGQR